MHLSGLVLDVYDDQSGEVLKSIYESHEAIPDFVKTAHALTSEEVQRLDDDVFALVLNSGGTVLRKYACIDPGNTALAVEYFLANRQKLPVEAQKVAAKNLATACDWYSIEPPDDLLKVAGLGRALNVGISAATVLPGAAGGTKSRLGQALQSGGVIDPSLTKASECSGTRIMPAQEDTNYATKPKATVRKTASRQLQPHVEVTSEKPGATPWVKSAKVTALNDMYPLDTPVQVKTANAWFAEYGSRLLPEERREFCANLVKQASHFGVALDEVARKYGSSTYAPASEIEFALDTRMTLVGEQDRALLSKLAAARPTVDPEVFAHALAVFDKTAGLNYHYGRDVLDPFYSTFGYEKRAAFSEVIGNDYVNEDMLREAAVSQFAFIKRRFGEELAVEFQKDPIGIFKSLPAEQKKVFARLSADTQPTNGQS
jgi:hypothetical protein